MSNRAERRAAARLTMKAAAVHAQLNQLQQQQHQQQQQSNPAVMAAAAAGSCAPIAPNVDFPFGQSESEPRPISDAKLAANRVNAQKSCGPTSDEGKAKVRLNALKTGLTGQTVLLPSDDVAAYETHIASFFTRHSPLGDEEHTLVQSIADTEWRILRIAPLESGIYAIGRLKLAHLHPEQTDPAVREGLIRTEIFLAYRKELSNLALQERRLRNQRKADLEELTTLQTGRKEKEKALDNVQTRMRVAVLQFLKYRRSNMRPAPDDLGLDFSMPEIEACVDAFVAAQNANQADPCFKTVILEFRNPKKEAA